MSLSFAFSTLFEIVLVALVFWGISNEDKLISLEKRIFASIKRRRLKVLKGNSVSFNKAS